MAYSTETIMHDGDGFLFRELSSGAAYALSSDDGSAVLIRGPHAQVWRRLYDMVDDASVTHGSVWFGLGPSERLGFLFRAACRMVEAAD